MYVTDMSLKIMIKYVFVVLECWYYHTILVHPLVCTLGSYIKSITWLLDTAIETYPHSVYSGINNNNQLRFSFFKGMKLILKILWFLYCVLYSSFLKEVTLVWMVSVLWTPLLFSVWQWVYCRHYYFWCPNSGFSVQWTPLHYLVSKPSVPWTPLVIGVQKLGVLWTLPQTFSVLCTPAFLVSKHSSVLQTPKFVHVVYYGHFSFYSVLNSG